MSDSMTIKIKTNIPEVEQALSEALRRGFKVCGDVAKGHAMKDCPVDTGTLSGSIDYDSDDKQMIVGTNEEYAPYVEYGTGIYGPHKSPIVPTEKKALHWKDKAGKDHFAKSVKGMKARPFIKPALSKHVDEYKKVLADELRTLTGKK